MKNNRDADYWIKKLELQKHPEGGCFREMYRSDEVISSNALPSRFSGNRNFSTSIYYMLNSGEFSSFHKIKSDELWHFYDGSALMLHIISPSGYYTKVLLGRNADEGECLQFAVPHGHWFSAEVKDENAFSLLGCTVAPGFDFTDFELASRNDLMKSFPDLAELIQRLTR